ncbi:MAG: molybdopterin-dependent oxidoreductase [Bacteroidales bacterium]|nr:molybdopterin-dependent oxidoreductase [Bacteroidales bacterium]
MSDKINIVLNGQNTTGLKGEYILDVAKRHGIEIPTLCNDPRLEPFSACYVCLIEIEGNKNLQPSCSTRIAEGMKINTDNDRIYKARKTALDLIMSNHYADCVAPCRERCPAGVDVQGYISLIEKGLYSEAVKVIKQTNPLPSICGRVCVRPCEAACRRNLLDEGTGVGIDYMKRFAADSDLSSKNHYKPEVAPSTGKKVAIIGAGPGGLSSAYFLQQKGHQCDIYEAQPHSGGWLRYGIPEYRLPNDIIQKETDCVTELGANIFYNKKLGESISYKEISEKYDATILTIGSQRGTLLGCDGEDADGVFSGIDFLRNMEVTGQRYDFTGKKIVVVGGGNTAMDCCRTSLRCKSTDVKVVYRRSEAEMPANPIEIHESKLEGVEYLFLTNPVRVNKDENGKLKSMTLIRMGLGEPDASGRRRPVPVEGSEFDIEVDYILAAIGQKTEINFLDDINKYAKGGQLKPTKWGDIDADKNTLQTGIPSVFAAGDGVTGPATLIEAVAQARLASHSCHLYLTGQKVETPIKEFLSKRDNFKNQEKDEYIGRYRNQIREEMPVMEPNSRVNFKEVELGYSEAQTLNETSRCLECGCVAYFDCDLKKHADTYKADQKRFIGEHKEFQLNIAHPYIEIDNNKCILCSRCVRICKEVVGANALTLVKRGFDTYVAPAFGDKLQDTKCESCGMCISACPTGAITENVPFKPGPVKLETFETICGYCSVGCKLTFHHRAGYVMKVTGAEGMVNKEGNLCMYGKFGYRFINDKSRITKPLHKVNGKFEEISFEKAFDIISEKIKSVKPDQNAFFAGAGLTNEEQYLVQKLARVGAKTNNVNSFHYLGGAKGFTTDSDSNVPFDAISGASAIYLLGSEINRDNAVAGYMVNAVQKRLEVISTNPKSTLKHKAFSFNTVKSYHLFIKAVNHYLIANGKQNSMFIKDNCIGYEDYKKNLLKEDYKKLCGQACYSECDCNCSCVSDFAESFNNEMNAILIFSEKEVGADAAREIINLAMITGKLGKTSSGIISLKQKNNSHGLFDMGVRPKTGVGLQDLSNAEFITKMKSKWGVNDFPKVIDECFTERFEKGEFKNLFIFGEDPIGCAVNRKSIEQIFGKANFKMVQDVFMSDTAKEADLILPASLWFETGGSFTNTQRMIQVFESGMKLKVEVSSVEQLIKLLSKFGSNGISDIHEANAEALSLLPAHDEPTKFDFVYTESDTSEQMFTHGCNYIMKRFDEEFEKALGK